jgi:hypothetical protein
LVAVAEVALVSSVWSALALFSIVLVLLRSVAAAPVSSRCRVNWIAMVTMVSLLVPVF